MSNELFEISNCACLTVFLATKKLKARAGVSHGLHVISLNTLGEAALTISGEPKEM